MGRLRARLLFLTSAYTFGLHVADEGKNADKVFSLLRKLTWPDAGGECFQCLEAELFVETDCGVIFGRDGERELLKFQTAQGIGGGEHESAAEALALMAGQHADLSGVADARRNLAGEDRAHQIIAARIVQNEGSAGDELAAAGQENNVFQKAQRAGLAAILVVDVTVDMVGVRQINQFGAGVEVAVVPAGKTQTGRGRDAEFGGLVQVHEHELPSVKLESLFGEGPLDGAAERHELRFDAAQVGDGAHREEHFFEHAARDCGLFETGRSVKAADQAFVLFQNVKRVPGSGAVFVGDAAG